MVTMFGQEFSMLVVLPLILIILTILGFIALMIYDARKSKKKIKKEEKEPEPIIESEIKIEEKEQKKEKIDIKKLKIEHLSALNSLEENINLINEDKALNEIIYIIRNFFSKLLNLNYFFTHEELEKELKKNKKKQKEKISFISKRLSSLQYDSNIINKKEILDLIHDLKDVIFYIETEEKEKEEKIFDRIIRHSKKQTSKQNEITKLIEYGNYMLTKDVNVSCKIYHQIYNLYDSLEHEDKEIIYNEIINYHNNIKKFLGS